MNRSPRVPVCLANNRYFFSLLLPLFLLSACESGKQEVKPLKPLPDLVFAFPYNGQKNIPTATQMLLKFNAPVAPSAIQDTIKLLDTHGKQSPLSVQVNQKDPTIVNLQPEERLLTGENYKLYFDDIETQDGPLIATNPGYISFFTQPQGSDKFIIEHRMPAGEFPFMTFSSLFLRFSKEVAKDTVIKDKTFHFYCTKSGAPVAGQLLVNANFLTFDPDHPLDPNCKYQVELTAAINSVTGDHLAAEAFTINPQATKSLPHLTFNFAANICGKVC